MKNNNLVQFPQNEDEAAASLLRKLSPERADSAKRMQDLIDDPDSGDRKKLEARMVQAIMTGDDDEFKRTTQLLEKINAKGISIIKGSA